MKGRTSFIIGPSPFHHSTADRIVVIVDGRIAESGTDAELIRAGRNATMSCTRGSSGTSTKKRKKPEDPGG